MSDETGWHARRHRLLAGTIDDAGVRAITRRFQLALAWIGAGTLLGALLPVLGVVVFTSWVIYYWLPISGEVGRARPRPALADAEPEASRQAGPGRPAGAADGPGEAGGDQGRPGRRNSNVGWPES